MWPEKLGLPIHHFFIIWNLATGNNSMGEKIAHHAQSLEPGAYGLKPQSITSAAGFESVKEVKNYKDNECIFFLFFGCVYHQVQVKKL